MSDTELTAARERSPRFPFISLKKALERAKELHDEHGRHAVRVESAANAWGYGPKSSGWRQTVAALLMYGILNDSGSGNDRKVQLTENAFKYIADERPEVREKLLPGFALAPKILRELFEVWGYPPPGDAECRSQLRIERDFTEGATEELLAIYKDNVAFAKLTGSGAVPPGRKAEEKDRNRAMDDLQRGSRLDRRVDSKPPPLDLSNPPDHLITHQEHFHLDEGEVTLTYPAKLSLESVAELEERMTIILKSAKRRADMRRNLQVALTPDGDESDTPG